MTTSLEEMIESGKNKIRKVTEKAFEGGIESQLGENATRQWLLERLEKERQAMFRKLMGIETSSNDLQIDDKGLFTQVLRPAMQEQLTQILQENFPQLIEEVWAEKGKAMTEAFKKNLRRSFENRLEYELNNRARKMGEETANKVVREMREELKL
jgi:hypothetical protein